MLIKSIPTKDEQMREFALIKTDILEFAKWVKIQEPGELEREYEIWPNLRDLFWQLSHEKLIDLLKSKQIGVSWGLVVYALWKIYTKVAYPVLVISKGEVESKALLSKAGIIYRNLPGWMQVFTPEPDTTERFGFKETKSIIKSYPSTETSGIGETAGLVIHDEADFHPFLQVNLSHTLATVADAPEWQLVIASTVDVTKPESFFKEHYRASLRGENGFKALFYGVFSRPNRDEAFYEAMVRENKDTPGATLGNYPRTVEEALKPQSAMSCFKEDVMQVMWEEVCEPVESRRNYIHIFHPWKAGWIYSAGIDVGEGVGLDYSVLTVLGKSGFANEVVAVIYTNQVGTDGFGQDCYDVCGEYGDPILCVDNIGIGRAVIDTLERLGYPKLYKSQGEKPKIGWALTQNNKRELALKLVEVVNSGVVRSKFKPMVKEMMEYQWVRGYPAPTGKTHGDTVISLMLANEMMKYAGPKRAASMYVGGRRVF